MDLNQKVIPIIVTAFSGQDYSEKCIESIYKHTKVPFHLIAVNNGSKDDTKKLFNGYASTYNNFTHIDLPENKGFAGGYNEGMNYALRNLNFDYLMILNNDSIVTPKYMERLVACLENSGKVIRKNNVGIVAPVTNYAGNRQMVSIPDLKTDEDIDNFSEEYFKQNAGKYFESGMLIGFCLLMKKEVLENAGLLDERFFAFYEDNDWSLRKREKGYISVVAADTFIYHFGSKTANNIDKAPNKLMEESRTKFIEKYKEINKIGQRKKLVGMMRVKNGEDCIATTLEAACRMCDNIVVLDDHSTDATPEICKKFSKVHYIKSSYNDFNEARDRNFLLQEVKKFESDWIFNFDHDEVPEEKLIENIQSLMNCENPEKKAYIFRICHLWNSPKTVRMDGLWGEFWQCRMFKNEPNQEIVGDDEGLHSGSTPSIPPENMAQTFYRIKHYGNMDPKGRENKYKWYTKTDANKDVNAILGRWAPYYKEIYYKNPKAILKDEDYYKHIVDETGMVLVPWVEYNTISACIIAKNEGKHLENALKSIHSFVDEIVIGIDSTSTDNTKEIALRYTDRVYDYVWNNDFSEARNLIMNKAYGHWILQIDADEVVPKEVIPQLNEAIQCTNTTAYLVDFKNWKKDPSDGDAEYEISSTFRLFKNEPGIYYSNCVHEDISDSLEKLTTIKNINIQHFQGIFHHFGYTKDEVLVKEKHARYSKLLEKQVSKDPNNFKAYLNYAIDLFHQGKLEEAEEYYNKVLKINPNSWVALNDLGVIYYQKAINLETMDKSQQYFQRALANVKVAPLVSKEKVGRVFSSMSQINNIRNSCKRNK